MARKTFNTGDIPSAADFNKFAQMQNDTAANWTSTNPVLALGDVGYETDTKKLKIGDGVTAWSSLSYRVSDASSVALLGGTSQGVVTVGPCIAQNGANRLNYRKAFAKVLSGQRARMLIYGDSTTAGAGGGTGGSTALNGALALAWPKRMAALLTTMGIPAYCDSLVGNQNVTGVAYSTYDPRVAATSWAPAVLSTIGRSVWRSSASGALLAFTPSMTFDTFDIITAASSSGGSFTVNVDGGATLTTVNTNNATFLTQKTTVSCTRGTHTINMTTTSASVCNVIAVIPYDSTLGGLDIVQAGWYGGLISSFSATTDPWNCSRSEMISAVAPDIAVVQLTINDASVSTDPATYAASLATVDAALAAAGASVMLMTGIPSDPGTVPATSQASIWAAVTARAQARGYVLADLGARSVDFATTNGAGWMFDDKHGNAKFYGDEAYWMARTLLAEMQ